MKKIILIALSLILVFSVFALSSCNDTSESSETNNSSQSTTGDGSETSTEETTLNDGNLTISGYVVDEYNKPIADANVVVDGNLYTTAEDGSYIVTVLKDSYFDIVASKSGYFSGEAKYVSEDKIEEDTNVLNIQLLKKHYVKGTVVNGAAPKSADTFEAANGAEVYVITDKKYSVPVNEDGSYELEFAATPFADVAVLFFEYEGFANTYSFVSVAKSSQVDGATSNMVVAPNTSFSGSVTSGGKPVKNAVIKILPKIDTSAAQSLAVKTIETVIYTDENGNYSSSDKSFICYSSEYTVIMEVRDLFGNATNEKGEKIRQMTQTVTVTDSREFTVDFSLS